MTQVPNPQFVPLTDPDSGKITREWLRIFQTLLSNSVSTADISALSDALSAAQAALVGLQVQVNAIHTASTGTTFIDFGPFPGSPAALVSVPVSANFDTMQAWVNPIASADHSSDEHLIETLKITAGNRQVGTGFTVYGSSTGPGFLYGKWNVSYLYQ